MKTASLLLLTAVLLSACAAPSAPAPTQVAEAPPTLAPVLATQAPAKVTPSFAAETFVDAHGRFGFQYPEGWTLLGGEEAARGSYVQIASWDPQGAGVESLPRGESLLQVAVYQWDPQADLAARVDMRTRAMQSSGMQIVEQTQVSFPNGPDAVRIHFNQSGDESLVYFFVLGNEYLELTGIGDLQLLDQVMRTFEYGS